VSTRPGEERPASDDHAWTGRTLVGHDGSRIGTLEHVYLGRGTDRPAWGVVTSGLLGRRRHFVPLHDATSEDDAVRAPVHRGQVRSAPAVSADREPDGEAESRLGDHYARREAERLPVQGHPREASAFQTLKRTALEFSDDKMTVWAAALTYYGLLSLFPALIAFVGIIGFFADPASATQTITDIVTGIGPSSAAETFSGPIESITSNNSAAGIMAIVGIVAALWSASGYVGTFIQASNEIYETPEGRPFWKLRPLQMLVTLVMLVLAVAVVLALILTGPVADAVAGPLGIGDTAVTVWQYAKWPVLILVVIAMIAVLYYASPNVKPVGFRSVLPGAAVALVVWIIASVGFAIYVANFGSYDKTYGTLGGVVIFLMWLWITNNAILLGAELNAERERSRQIEAGVPHAERRIALEPRGEPKRPKTA
jgi:membrane protein